MLRFYYSPEYKYTNRKIINIENNNNYREINYINIDSPDTINGHIIYSLEKGENIPSYVLDIENNKRYYVSGITQLRTGKFQISLLRDIISEDPELWKNEQAYITAGTALDFNKYKTWGLPFTNTKVREQRLNINGKSSFFVYYVNTQNINGAVLTEQDLEIEYATIEGVKNFDFEVSNLNEIPNYNIISSNQEVNYWQNVSGYLDCMLTSSEDFLGLPNGYNIYRWSYDKNSDSFNAVIREGAGFANRRNNNLDMHEVIYKDLNKNQSNSKQDFKQSIYNFLDTDYLPTYGYTINENTYNQLESYVNKFIRNTTDNKVYTVKKVSNVEVYNIKLSQEQCNSLISRLRNVSWPKGGVSPIDYTQRGEWFSFTGTRVKTTYTLELEGVANSFNFNFIAQARKLPKSAVRCVNIVSSGDILDSDIAQALMLAQTNPAMSEETAGTGRILDIQYLPFSVATEVNENFKVNNESIIAQFLDTDDFEYNIDLPDLENINKETDSIKIVSPSRASQFLFKPHNNDGNMRFDTKITIKPYTSVIYIRPSTQGLLQADWDDKDCLIIEEDFSLTKVDSAWANYIYNNRNYQNAFNRQIEGREFERSWERRIEQAQIPAENWAARNISAQKAQTYTGNLPIVSNILGALATSTQDSAYMQAAQLDREYNEALYQESLDLSRDLFNMQLENIKSQPNIPSRITTIDIKFLDGVYLEFYSTNPTELLAIQNFYRYNGNRIDCYGTFNDYWGWFVKGKIIISENYTQPELNELNRRLNIGIFTEVEYD